MAGPLMGPAPFDIPCWVWYTFPIWPLRPARAPGSAPARKRPALGAGPGAQGAPAGGRAPWFAGGGRGAQLLGDFLGGQGCGGGLLCLRAAFQGPST